MKSQVRVRGFSKRPSPVVAVAWFEHDAWETHLDFTSHTEDIPRRNTIRVPGLLMQDRYDGKADPKMSFLDILYACVADSQRRVQSRLAELGVEGVTMPTYFDEQNPGHSFLRISAADRSPTSIELAGDTYMVDPVELAAAGLVVAFHVARSAQVESLMNLE